MLLVIDVGNTNIVLGVYNKENLICDFRLNTIKNKTSDEYALSIMDILHANNINKSKINDVVIASVVPDVMHSIENAIKKYLNLKPIVLCDNLSLPIKINHDNPETIGIDRLVNCIAGIKKYKSPLIIIDIGTAITFDVVDDENIYQGGAIVSGIGISSEALFLKTAKLPKVELFKPSRVVCKNTVDNIRSGMVIGYIGLIEKLITEMKNEMNFSKNLKVIATGGYVSLISKHIKMIDVIDKKLTLDGLCEIYKIKRGIKND